MNSSPDDDDTFGDPDTFDEFAQGLKAYHGTLRKRRLLSLGRLKLGAWYDIDFAAHRLPVCVLAIDGFRRRVLVECPFWRVKDSVWIDLGVFVDPEGANAVFLGYGKLRNVLVRYLRYWFNWRSLYTYPQRFTTRPR